MAPAKQPAGRRGGPFAGPLRRHGQRPRLPADRHRPRRLRGRRRARHGLLGLGAAGEAGRGGPRRRAGRRPIARRPPQFAAEMHTLRFGLKPSAVYFNPTERCNLNCTYCYIPEQMRRSGPAHVRGASCWRPWRSLKRYFRTTVPKGTLPQIIFHGAEPLLNREAVFAGIEQYARRFPLRHPDQRHAAGRRGRRVPPRPRREHRHLAGRAHGRRSPTARGRTGTARASIGQVVEAMDRLERLPGLERDLHDLQPRTCGT